MYIDQNMSAKYLFVTMVCILAVSASAAPDMCVWTINDTCEVEKATVFQYTKELFHARRDLEHNVPHRVHSNILREVDSLCVQAVDEFDCSIKNQISLVAIRAAVDNAMLALSIDKYSHY